MIGQTVSHYRILNELGRGGMGEVFLAEDTRLARKVAVKFLPPGVTSDPIRVHRFELEARAASALNHPNIVTVFDIGDSASGRFLVMERVEGRTLRELSVPGKPIDEVLSIGEQMARALGAAHSAGITHRDIKPENIMVREDGYVKILDFGLARLRPAADSESHVSLVSATAPGTLVGTIRYMSPEQARGEEAGSSSDIFALGTVLYELATGQHPIRADSPLGYLHAITSQTPAKPAQVRTDLPSELDDLIVRMLDKESSQRPTAHEVARALQDLQRERHRSAPRGDGETLTTAAPRSDLALKEFWVAVLPLKCPGGNVDLESLAEGLSEEIVTGLSRFSYLKVISRSSSLRYAQESRDIRTVGQELGARYVMEGSLRQAGEVLRLSVQLVDATTGAHLWAETYNRTFRPEGIFELQDDLAGRIVSTVADANGILPRRMGETVRRRNPDELTPYEAVLRSFAYFGRVTAKELEAAKTALNTAVRRVPDYSDAWAMLGLLWGQQYAQGFPAPEDVLVRAAEAAQRAVETGPANHLAHFSLAQARFFQREFDAFRNAARRAAELNPMDGNSLAFLGELLVYTGDSQWGLALAERAKQLNPTHPGWYWYAEFYHAYRARDYETALAFAQKINLPNQWFNHAVLAASYAQLGQARAAGRAVENVLRLRPDFPSTWRDDVGKWWESDYIDHLADGWRKAGLNLAEDPVPSREAPLSTPGRFPLVGRETEWRELQQFLSRAEAGLGRFVLLSGEPGVGKTRLAVETLELARKRNLLGLVGRAQEDETVPFLLITEVLSALVRSADSHELVQLLGKDATELSRLVPEIAPTPSDSAATASSRNEQHRLFTAVSDLVGRAASHRPLAILLDDLHWADHSSLLLIEHLASRVRDMPVLLLATYRDVASEMGPTFRKFLANRVRLRQVERIRISRLSQKDVACLLTSAAGKEPPARTLESIYQQTEGNPFYVEETLHHLTEERRLLDSNGQWRTDVGSTRVDVPEGIRLVVGLRLDRLQKQTRTLLVIGATVGRRFEPRVVEAVSGLDVQTFLDSLEEAEAAGLINEHEDGTSYSFSHELIRQALKDRLSTARQRRLHMEIARTIEALYPDETEKNAGIIAFHLSRAGSLAAPDKQVEYSRIAGEQALRTYAWEAAATHFERGLEGIPDNVKDRRKADLWFGLGRAQAASLDVHRAEIAVQSLTRAFDLYQDLGDMDAATAAASYPVFVTAGHRKGVSQLLQRGLSVAPDGSPARGHLLSRFGWAKSQEEADLETALGAFDEALEIAEMNEDATLRLTTLCNSSFVNLLHLRMEESERAATEALQLVRPGQNQYEEMFAQTMLAGIHSSRGKFLLARSEIEKARTHAATLGDISWLTTICWFLASVTRQLGEWDVATTTLEEGLHLWPDDVRLLGLRAQVAAELGDLETCRKRRDRMLEVLEKATPGATDDYAYPAMALPLLGRLTSENKHREIAGRAARSVVESPSASPFLAQWANVGLAFVSLASKDEATLAQQYETLSDGQPEFASGSGCSISRILGLLAAALGKTEVAQRHFEEALETCRQSGAKAELAWVCLEFGAFLTGIESTSTHGIRLLKESSDLASELTMTAVQGRVTALRQGGQGDHLNASPLRTRPDSS